MFDAASWLNDANLRHSPTVAIMQWKHEIETHSEGMKVLVWHGSSRATDIKELKKYDVVRQIFTFLLPVY